ncbi:MAG: replication factor C small subunit, partial [DPANN group archaeon]|nr:replication factor C small subunit [DPANN group archaeon]
DERGIDVVRVKIKDFARTRAVENVPFKVIYLDEADALTREAQDALRRIMEDYTQTVRFVLSCNYSSKIIPPIQSRCAIFRFKPLAKEIIDAILQKVAQTEGLNVDKEALDLIYEAAEGDMRKAHNLMQACAAISPEINHITVSQVVSFAEPKEVELVVKSALNGKFVDAKKILTDVMVKHGLSGIDMIKQIQKEAQELQIDERVKIRMIKACGEAEFRMVEGSNEFIQLAALLAEFAIIGGE